MSPIDKNIEIAEYLSEDVYIQKLLITAISKLSTEEIDKMYNLIIKQ